MYNIIVYENKRFGNIRTFVEEGKQEPWFVAADVCRALEAKNARDAVARLDDDEKNTVVLTDGNRGNPNVTVVSEPGLYALVLSSRKPEAKEFKRWITHDVIPSIRKSGGYIAGQEDMSDAARGGDFRYDDWSGRDGLLVGKENEPVARLRYTDVYQLHRFDSGLRRSGCACGVVGGITMTVIGLLCLLAATVCVACAFINKE